MGIVFRLLNSDSPTAVAQSLVFRFILGATVANGKSVATCCGGTVLGNRCRRHACHVSG